MLRGTVIMTGWRFLLLNLGLLSPCAGSVRTCGELSDDDVASRAAKECGRGLGDREGYQ